LTRRAVAARPGEDVLDLVHAPLWGLVRSAQAEHPDLPVVLVDLDDNEGSVRCLATALASGERQLALRDGTVHVPTLAPLRKEGILKRPNAEAWRLDVITRGTLDALALVVHPDATAPLAPEQVRIAVRAAGLNFRDVLNALGTYPGEAGFLGLEGAGVVTE